MTSRRTFRILKVLGLVSVLLAGAHEAQSAQTYFIDQNVVYPVDGTCSMLAPPGTLPDDRA